MRCTSRSGRIAAVALLWLVAACGSNGTTDLSDPFARRVTTFQAVPAGRVWVNAPGSILTMERVVGAEREQVVALPNNTAVQGDNALILRAFAPGREAPGRLQFDALRRRIGGFPAPFDKVTESDFVIGTDELGTYSWVQESYGATTVCVLAMRRFDGGERLIPQGMNGLDAVLRNCVNGDSTAALSPIRAETIGYGRRSGLAGQTGSRLLSPLAGPLPDR
ncbi:hypothetical protein [Frigidibacter oleivorans]|uniref:hypothetical protein n=1 Tax=Frigidibacter oleivorans TaxID=2487129 RepID=UPI000F8D4E4D|nr:hypothetical protein [Frigidibacter oleivorans]